ncbi:MAG: glycosyltransferase family 4 protein [Candidatus Odinarchaeota archaeon]|nr:glycosyltransferase family 4 protein [Candidatus Odinarchaeota archaeon]
MKIAFFMSHPEDESPGSVIRVKELAKGLGRLNHEAHIYSPFPGDRLKDKNVHFHRVKMFGAQSKTYKIIRGILNRPLLARNLILRPYFLEKTLSTLANNIHEEIKNEDMDIIQGEQEVIAAALVKIRDKLDVPIVSDLHNLWPEELVVSGVLKRNSSQYEYLVNLEKEILEKSDLVTVVSKKMKEVLVEQFDGDKNKIVIIPPGGRVRLDKPKERRLDLFKVIYAGLVVYRENITLFVKSMPEIKKKIKNVKFFITNKGEELPKIKKLARELNVNPKFFWYPSSRDFFEFLSTCHVGVIPSSFDLPRQIGTPVKLFDYMSVGVPVVANKIDGWTDIIKEENVGILTGSSPEEFAKGILYFLENPDEIHRYGLRGIKLIKEKYNWDTSAQKLLSAYQKIA